MELLVAERKYTVQEFEQLEELDENYYYELIDGEIVQKSSPHFLHQRVLGRLFIALTSFVNEKKIGEVFIAPLDVYL
jgi:Uma2 family endonuclease